MAGSASSVSSREGPLPPAGFDRKIGLTIFGDKELEGATMFRAGRSRSFKELMFRGALSLICCATAALGVGGLLSVLAENLGPKAPTNDVDRTPCKTINCVLKSKGPRLAHSEKPAFQ
jgi:hypothetical protein